MGGRNGDSAAPPIVFPQVAAKLSTLGPQAVQAVQFFGVSAMISKAFDRVRVHGGNAVFVATCFGKWSLDLRKSARRPLSSYPLFHLLTHRDEKVIAHLVALIQGPNWRSRARRCACPRGLISMSPRLGPASSTSIGAGQAIRRSAPRAAPADPQLLHHPAPAVPLSRPFCGGCGVSRARLA